MRKYTSPLRDVPNLAFTFELASTLVRSLPPDIQNTVRNALMDTFRLGWNLQNLYSTRTMNSASTGDKSADTEKYCDDILKLKKGFLDMLENIPRT